MKTRNRSNRTLVVVATLALMGWGLGAKDDKLTIGLVDLDQAITSTNEGRAAREEFDRKKRLAEQKLIPLIEQYREQLDALEAKKFVLSDDARVQKQLDLAELQNQIENGRKEMEGQLRVDRERLIAPLQTKLLKIVEEVGQEEGFALILHRNAPGVMYSKESLDITELVIARFNKKG
jgi:Skp family chaperone for outer membrane proteins